MERISWDTFDLFVETSLNGDYLNFMNKVWDRRVEKFHGFSKRWL
jgi:hypothetical protein